MISLFSFRLIDFYAQHEHIEFTRKMAFDSDDKNAQKTKCTLVTRVK